MRKKRKVAFVQCEYCESWVPKKYLAHHENVCLVRRGLKPKEPREAEKENIYVTAKKGESIQDLLERVRKK